MSILFEQLLEALAINDVYKKDIEEDISARPNMNKIYSLMDEYEISSDILLNDLLVFLPDSALKDFADYEYQMYSEYNDLTSFDEALNEGISDRGDIGPKVLAKLEDVVNSKTKFKLDTDPDGRIILTDSKQLNFKVDIDRDNNLVLLDAHGKVFIKDKDPEEFIRKILIFITD